jgi:predicted glycogen debranching enzyme
MDAKVGDWVVTPRRGYAVEIQALWYNALLIGADLARGAGETQRGAEWAALAGKARESFLRAFWSESVGYLADVVAAGTPDLSLRPNQLYAIGLPHALLPRDKAVRVLEVVKRHLLTPVGLRTLAPSDPHYRGRYEGDPRSRDAAYHQGTVWAWLIGPFVDAWLLRACAKLGDVKSSSSKRPASNRSSTFTSRASRYTTSAPRCAPIP